MISDKNLGYKTKNNTPIAHEEQRILRKNGFKQMSDIYPSTYS